MDDPQKKRRAPWRGPAGVVIFAAIALAVIWTRGSSQQDRVLRTGGVLIVSVLLFFLWAIFFTRLRGRTRALLLLAGVFVVGALSKSVEIKGVSGDLVPILRWKWTHKTGATVASAGAVPVERKGGPTFPQFLGSDRNGVIRGVALDTNWSATPPRELWRHPVGAAWTGFVVADGIAVTQEQFGERELVTAYDLETGKLIWSHEDQARYFTTLGGEGPRANPTIFESKVYALGATGILNCLDLQNGKAIWSKDLVKENGASVPSWGFAGAPLVADGLVMVNAGGKPDKGLVAYDAATGNFVWGGGDDSAGYSSPTVMTLGGAKQIVLFSHARVEGHDPSNGKVLWTHPWPSGHPHCSMPIQISADTLLASSGYGYGSELLKISRTNGGWSAERVWKSNRLKSKFGNLIFYNGFVYGLDDGVLVCFDPAAGERKWQGDRHGHGELLLVDDLLLMMAENGEVFLIRAAPDEERVVARFRALTGKTWNPPALAGEYLLVRNDAEAACFKVPLASKRSLAHAPPQL
jgi:outer membrane protein assembly factor BamB